MDEKRDVKFYFERSEERLKNGQIGGGLADLDYAIRLDPNFLEGYRRRAEFRYDGKEYQLAIEDLTKIIELSDDIDEIADCRKKRAICYEHVGLYWELVKDLDWLIENGFGTVTRYDWRGLHKFRAGDFEAAIRDFSEAYKMSPDISTYLLQRGYSYYYAHRYEEAIQDFNTILESYESHPLFLRAVYIWRGRTYFKMGEHDKALKDFNEELRLIGNEPFSSALAYMQQHHPQDLVDDKPS
ncbi:MAG: hypothetical protein BroJett018_49950 [Chloroflexota bacterium]|nr:hypothetical protein [Chloroflexota bacterium]NOG64399.1 tetratricopeptide repeat protein [Chloroflexota bacterium]GIK67201.1 MAG: hypothetical protein BroJett018_49950 [Chloroflexota bacterium]